MSLSEWLNTNWMLLSTVGASITGITGWFLGGKKQKEQELKNKEEQIAQLNNKYRLFYLFYQ